MLYCLSRIGYGKIKERINAHDEILRSIGREVCR